MNRTFGNTKNRIIVGITGGIGAGKSEVTDYLCSLGYTVIDADEVAREAVMPGEPALAALVREFGAGILRPDGTLDRVALAALAFGTDDSTAKLNDILHADIIARIEEKLRKTISSALSREEQNAIESKPQNVIASVAKQSIDTPNCGLLSYAARTRSGLTSNARNDGVAVHPSFLSAPLLFESGLAALCDTVWLITAPEDIRVARAAARDMAPEEDIRARAAKQMSEDERRAKADLIIDNSKEPKDLLRAVQHALDTI